MTGTTGPASALARFGFLDRFDGRRRSAPPAGDLLGDLGQELLVLDGELATDRIVVEGARPPRGGDVEPGEVAARSAAVAGGHGGRTLTSGTGREGGHMEPRLQAVCDLMVPVVRENAGLHVYDGTIQDLS